METEYFNVENFRYEKDKMEILWGPISGGGALMSFPSLYTVHKLTNVVHRTNKHTYTHKQINTHTQTNRQPHRHGFYLAVNPISFKYIKNQILAFSTNSIILIYSAKYLGDYGATCILHYIYPIFHVFFLPAL